MSPDIGSLACPVRVNGTAVRCFTCVSEDVFLQVVLCKEASVAMQTIIRLFACMGIHMPIQIEALSEGLVTMHTRIWALTRVCTNVHF